MGRGLRWSGPWAVWLWAVVGVGGARGQSVDVTLLEAPGGSPIAGAMVTLVDSVEGSSDRELTDVQGRASLRAPHAGTWRLVAERIGYGTIASVPFELGEGEALPVTLRAPVEPIELEALEVRADAACRPDRWGARPAAVVWEEARKALERVVWTRSRESYRFEVVLHDRRLGVRGRVREEETREVEVAGIRPFATLPPELLSDEGFIQVQDQDTLYFGPDAEVLLSDAFGQTHCFHTTLDESGSRVGLAFEPLDPRGSDIAGTLWLDAETAALLEIEFRYTGPIAEAIDRPHEGRIAFRSLPDGSWIVERWWIRLPVLSRRLVWVRGGVRVSGRRHRVFDGYREKEGVVRAVEQVGEGPE